MGDFIKNLSRSEFEREFGSVYRVNRSEAPVYLAFGFVVYFLDHKLHRRRRNKLSACAINPSFHDNSLKELLFNHSNSSLPPNASILLRHSYF